ncbi:MAG: histone deacetylase family protein [Alphaproteobacteria bacterium]
MTTTIISHPDCQEHTNGPGHPEQPARLPAVIDALMGLDQDGMVYEQADKGDVDAIKALHDAAYVDHILASAPAEGLNRLDPDTCMSPKSADAALYGVGAACRAVDLVMSGGAQNAFCATRPPGHHAETAKAMGFCLFGNVAIAAKYAEQKYGLTRIAVADFDVHHGNGTQDLLWSEANMLFASSHEMPLYPGTGAASEVGAHNNIINMPLMSGATSAEFQAAWEPTLKRFDDFKPELVFISAGFDAHMLDPLAGLNLIEKDFAWITNQLCDLADKHASGRLVSVLEGGYNLDALASSAATHVEILRSRGLAA